MEALLGVFCSWLHILATTVWLGGMITNLVVVTPAARRALGSPEAVSKLSGLVLSRFRPLVYVSLAVLLVTGIFMSAKHSGNVATGNWWPKVMLLKHILFALMAVNAVFILDRLFPRHRELMTTAPSDAAATAALVAARRRLLLNLVRVNACLGVVVLLLSAIASSLSR